MTPPLFTLGIEEEYQILDASTGALKPDVKHLLSRVEQNDAGQHLDSDVQSELMQSQIETASHVCETLADVRAALVRSRSALLKAADEQGLRIGAAGTHPFTDWHNQPTTPKVRYYALVDDYQQLAREQLIFGCHVHVGLDDRETAVRVMNRARPWLAPLIALSASSPFWQGDDTGYDSFRTALWSRWPLSGPPPLFRSYGDYQLLIQSIMETGSIKDAGHIYWDLRLPKQHRTIEFRVMDVCPTVDEAVMIAGLVRALVRTCHERALREEPFIEARNELLRSVHWRAARYGLEDQLFDLDTGQLVPAPTLIERLLGFVREALEAEGDWDDVKRRVDETLRGGNGARRQRAAYRRAGRWEDVVELITRETASGLQ